MFIPTWLLILVVVIVVSIVLPGTWDAIHGLTFMLFVLLVIVSIPASLYYFSQDDTQTAWIVSLPWIAVVAWGLWLGGFEAVKTSLWLHEMRVRSASKPQEVEKLRRHFADALDLGSKMWQFREDVQHLPSW